MFLNYLMSQYLLILNYQVFMSQLEVHLILTLILIEL